jgi:hypothetical protein
MLIFDWLIFLWKKLRGITTNPYIPESCEIEAPAAPKPALRISSEPDFWDPNYRSYRIVRLYVEVDSIYAGFYGTQTESVVRDRWARISRNAERLYGIRFEIQTLKINTTPDSLESITSAGTLLATWANQASINTRPEPFKFRISGRNMGGIAYISRGAVTSAKYAVCGFGRVSAGTDERPGLDEYGWLHEVMHNLGISHSHNCCAWQDKAGTPLGKLDDCFAGERTCTPVPSNCSTSQRRMEGGINSYAHIWGTQNWWMHPSCVATLHRALFNSDLPSYTPAAAEGPIPYGIQPLGTTFAGVASNVMDGSGDTRWVTSGPASIRCMFSATRRVRRIRILTGFFSGGVWSSPVASLRVQTTTGETLFTITGNTRTELELTLDRELNGLVFWFDDLQYNRIREIQPIGL